MNTLPEDCVMEILSHLDPLARTLVGMTCATHERLVQKWRDRFNRLKNQNLIWSLLELYGNVPLFQWAIVVWPDKSNNRCHRDTALVLSVRNFELAAWLVEHLSYRISGFNTAMENRDYEVMNWCYANGFRPSTHLQEKAQKTRDPQLIQWFKERKTSESSRFGRDFFNDKWH